MKGGSAEVKTEARKHWVLASLAMASAALSQIPTQPGIQDKVIM
jgi:hypothetical protein